MTRARSSKSFTQRPPIPEEGIEAAVAVMRSGRLHRYNRAPGEVSDVMEVERECARWQGTRFCLAVASGGQMRQVNAGKAREISRNVTNGGSGMNKLNKMMMPAAAALTLSPSTRASAARRINSLQAQMAHIVPPDWACRTSFHNSPRVTGSPLGQLNH